MCNYISLLSEAQELEEYFGAVYQGEPYHRDFRINGFSNPQVPVILDEEPNRITNAEWGFIPKWAKDRNLQKNTLNARLEEAADKPSYKNAVQNRCLILVNAFHEWKWLDSKGKQKDNYLIKIRNQPLFALGGLYNFWTDPATNRQVLTCTVGTTQANELMAEIHNTKHRMPVILSKKIQNKWLDDISLQYFTFPNYDPDLEAENLTRNEQPTLF